MSKDCERRVPCRRFRCLSRDRNNGAASVEGRSRMMTISHGPLCLFDLPCWARIFNVGSMSSVIMLVSWWRGPTCVQDAAPEHASRSNDDVLDVEGVVRLLDVTADRILVSESRWKRSLCIGRDAVDIRSGRDDRGIPKLLQQTSCIASSAKDPNRMSNHVIDSPVAIARIAFVGA